MKDKLILNEDLDLELPSYEGQDIRDLYEDQGIDLFSEENIPLLKQAGLLDEAGYPIEKYEGWYGEIQTRPMSMYDLFSLDEGFIESPYIRQLAIKELFSHAKVNDSGTITVKYTDSDLPQIRDISKDFLEGCFSGDVWDYFIGYGDYDFRDCKYILDDIPSEVLDILEGYGFPRDIYNELMENTADEDAPLAEWYESLKDALVTAYRQGEENGSAYAAESDFNEAFRNSMPDGVQWIEQESTESVRPLSVSKDFIENCLEGIWEYLDTYSEDMYSSFIEYLKQTINDNLVDNFKEPYYGWQEFDADSFGDRLLDEIMELNIPEQSAVDLELDEPEKDLLKFDGESGEYHEDLELDTDIQIEKPKKLFYKYKDYNKEISSKAYRLNYVMVSELLEFLRDPENRRYVGAWDLRDLEEYAINPEDAQYVILSSIKPSYLSTYGQHGYTIWIDNGDYDLNYIGWIPKQVGDSILHSMAEDLELDVDYIPDIDIDSQYYFDGVEELILGKMNEEIWGVYIVNWLGEDVEYQVSAVNLETALEKFNHLRKTGIEDGTTAVLYVYDDESGDDVPLKSFDSRDSLNEDLEPELHYYFVWWCDENDLEDGEIFRTPLVTKQTTNVKPTPAEVVAIYSEDETWQGNPGYVIVDVDETTKEEFEDYFTLPADYHVFDLTAYDSVDLNEEETLPDYTYYECYMEPADETTWNPDTYDWDGEPSYYNESALIKVHDSQPEPTPVEAELFLDAVGLLPKGYTVLYLSELTENNEWVQDADEIPEYLPKVNAVDIGN